MRTGQMEYRIELQTSLDSTDTNGQSVKVWKTAFERWASIDPVGGSESASGNHQVVADATHTLRLHYDRQTSQISPINRVKFGTRIFNISRMYHLHRRDVVLQVTERIEGMGAA